MVAESYDDLGSSPLFVVAIFFLMFAFCVQCTCSYISDETSRMADPYEHDAPAKRAN